LRPLKAALPDEPAAPLPEAEFNDVLHYHDGDAAAAVRTLLEDCRHLREQLVLAQMHEHQPYPWLETALDRD